MNSFTRIEPALREHAQVRFERSVDGRCFVARQQVGYPFHLGRNLQLPDDPAGMAAVYMQSCSGGLFAGENLGVRLHAGQDALAHVSTGAATVAHGMLEAPAMQCVHLQAESGALLEYLPMATILFPRARVHSRIEAVLHPGARMMLCDSFGLHAPGSVDGVFDWYRADLDVFDADGKLMAGDRLYVEGDSFQLALPGINAGVSVIGTFMMLGEGDAPLEPMRAALAQVADLYAGASALPNGCGVVVRMAAAEAPAVRNGLHAAWAAMRLLLTGREPAMRRK